VPQPKQKNSRFLKSLNPAPCCTPQDSVGEHCSWRWLPPKRMRGGFGGMGELRGVQVQPWQRHYCDALQARSQVHFGAVVDVLSCMGRDALRARMRIVRKQCGDHCTLRPATQQHPGTWCGGFGLGVEPWTRGLGYMSKMSTYRRGIPSFSVAAAVVVNAVQAVCQAPTRPVLEVSPKTPACLPGYSRCCCCCCCCFCKMQPLVVLPSSPGASLVL